MTMTTSIDGDNDIQMMVQMYEVLEERSMDFLVLMCTFGKELLGILYAKLKVASEG